MNKNYLYLFVILIIVGLVLFVNPSDKLTDEELEVHFSLLSTGLRTGSCSGINHLDSGEFLKGACCGKMRLERYNKQRRVLEKYSDVGIIPKDPWNVSVDLANKLMNYDQSLVLNEKQQETYNLAFEYFEEGPCCCKCWRWFTFSGLAKYLIVEEGYDSKQIAELWASEDVCGDEDPFDELKIEIS